MANSIPDTPVGNMILDGYDVNRMALQMESEVEDSNAEVKELKQILAQALEQRNAAFDLKRQAEEDRDVAVQKLIGERDEAIAQRDAAIVEKDHAMAEKATLKQNYDQKLDDFLDGDYSFCHGCRIQNPCFYERFGDDDDDDELKLVLCCRICDFEHDLGAGVPGNQSMLPEDRAEFIQSARTRGRI